MLFLLGMVLGMSLAAGANEAFKAKIKTFMALGIVEALCALVLVNHSSLKTIGIIVDCPVGANASFYISYLLHKVAIFVFLNY